MIPKDLSRLIKGQKGKNLIRVEGRNGDGRGAIEVQGKKVGIQTSSKMVSVEVDKVFIDGSNEAIFEQSLTNIYQLFKNGYNVSLFIFGSDLQGI